MLPEEAPPPGLAELFGGGMPEEEPDEIQVAAPGMDEPAPEEPAVEEEAEGISPDEQAILDAIQDLIRNSTDAAYQAKVGKIAADLAKVMAEDEDAAMSAMGGNPKQMRAMQNAYGS